MTPQRVQLSRQPRWRLPEGCIVVARPTKWGNPFRLTPQAQRQFGEYNSIVVSQFEDMVRYSPVTYYVQGLPYPRNYPSLEQIKAELAGHDLACWCPLVDANGNRVPCHASVLLLIANS